MAAGAMTIDLGGMPEAKGGLVNVLSRFDAYREVSDPHLGAGAVYEQLNCGVPDLAPGLCDDSLGIDPATEKIFETPVDDESAPFGVYTGVACLPGFHDYAERARRRLEATAEHGYGLGFQKTVLDFAPPVNVGSPISVRQAIALAEESLAANASGIGYISVGRYGASHLTGYRGVKNVDDTMLETRQGTPIINSTGVVRAHGETTPSTTQGFFLWVHAPVTLWVGQIMQSRGYDLAHNVESALAEQVAVFSKPCFSGAIEIDPNL